MVTKFQPKREGKIDIIHYHSLSTLAYYLGNGNLGPSPDRADDGVRHRPFT